MRTEKLGGLTCRIAGGADREGGGDGPVAVLLHGFGASGEDLVGLWRELDVPKGTRFVFPAAPLELDLGYGPPGSSRAWWLIDMERMQRAIMRGEMRDLTAEVPDGLPAARDAAIALLDDVEEKLGADPARLVLGGFSQGAMLSLDVALRTTRQLAGLVLLSGTLLAEHEWVPRLPTRTGLPVLQSHGVQDPLLPYVIAERLRDHMVAAGLRVEWVPFRGQHEIPLFVRQKMGAFLHAALA